MTDFDSSRLQTIGILVIAVAALVLRLRVGYITGYSKWKRGGELLDEWARANRYEILNAYQCAYWAGPFTLRSNGFQCVYKVALQDVTGEVHHAWLRFGSWFRGVGADDIAIRWIDGEPDFEEIAGYPKPRERFVPGKPVHRAKKKLRGK